MKPPIVAPDSVFPDLDSELTEVTSGFRVREGEVSICYEETFKSLFRANLYLLLKHKPSTWVFMGASIFWCVYLLGEYIVTYQFSLIRLLLLAIFFVGITNLQFALFVLLICVMFARRFLVLKRNRLCTFSFTPEGFCDATPFKTTKAKWEKVTCMRFDSGDVHFIKGAIRGGCFVPREAFQNLQNAKTFYGIAYEIWKSNGGAWYEVTDQYPTVNFKEDTSQ